MGAVAEGLPEEVPFPAVAGGRAARPSERPGEGCDWQGGGGTVRAVLREVACLGAAWPSLHV